MSVNCECYLCHRQNNSNQTFRCENCNICRNTTQNVTIDDDNDDEDECFSHTAECRKRILYAHRIP